MGEHTNSSANIFAARETWSLGAVQSESGCFRLTVSGGRTDDERNHACAIATGGFKTLDELLDLPYLNVLLRFVPLRSRHGCGGVVVVVGEVSGSGARLRKIVRGGAAKSWPSRGGVCSEGAAMRKQKPRWRSWGRRRCEEAQPGTSTRRLNLFVVGCDAVDFATLAAFTARLHGHVSQSSARCEPRHRTAVVAG